MRVCTRMRQTCFVPCPLRERVPQFSPPFHTTIYLLPLADGGGTHEIRFALPAATSTNETPCSLRLISSVQCSVQCTFQQRNVHTHRRHHTSYPNLSCPILSYPVLSYPVPSHSLPTADSASTSHAKA